MTDRRFTAPLVGDPVLQQWILRHHAGGPTGIPQPGRLVKNFGSGWREDRIEWGFKQPVADVQGQREADGFLVRYGPGDTDDPVNAVKVSITRRAFSNIVPAGVVMSYAIAAYRETVSGEFGGPVMQVPCWRNVGGGVAGAGVLTETLDCTGSFVETTDLIPAGGELFAVRTLVTAEVDVANFQVGIESLPNAWGVSGPHVDDENDRTTFVWQNPAWFSSHVPIRLTFPTPATTGQVEVTIWFNPFDLP